jgi:hypothetical protein
MGLDIQVILNGVLLNDDEFDGTADSKITIRQKDKEGLAFSYGNNLQLYGRARDIVFDNVINTASPFTSFITIVLRDKCCKDELGANLIIFEGKIGFGDVKWCEKDCFIDVSFEDNSKLARQITCIKNTPIILRESLDGSRTSAGEDEAKSAVYYKYCVEGKSSVLAWMRLFFVTITLGSLFPIILIFSNIVLIINGIISFINLFGANIPLINTVLQDPIQLQNTIYNNVIGCNRKHKAPFVFAYIRNVCRLCGLNLQSTLFNPGGPYHNLTHLNIPFRRGAFTTPKADEIFITENFPSFTLTQFLAQFATLNIDFSIEGDNLVVERKDYFSSNIWIDFSTRQSDIIELCYEFGDEGPKAGRIYEYQEDASDIGEEANRFWGGPVVDYNKPTFNPNLKGVDTVSIPFSPTRFIDDNFGSVLYQFRNSPSLKPLIDDNIMLLMNGSASSPKLLMWDPSTNKEEAGVQKIILPSGRGAYNVDAWMRSDIGQIFPSQQNFYTRLLYIDDPRESIIKRQNYEIVFEYSCDDLRSFEFGSRIKLLQGGGVVVGTVENIEIDYQRKQIKITGKI